MENSPLFSILVASYNNASFINDFISSVEKQIYGNIEIIVVDDCSKDDSFSIFKRLEEKDSRFHVYKNDINRGCGYTKRRCVELANGEFCGFVDPDDAITPDAIHLMVQKHIQEPDVSLIGSRFFHCNENLKIYDVASPLGEQINSFTSQLDYPYFINHFVTFKKRYYDLTEGLNPNYIRAVDRDLYFKLEEVGKVAFIDKPLYLYRHNKNSISLNKNAYKACAWEQVILYDTCLRRKVSFDKYIRKESRQKRVSYSIFMRLYTPVLKIKRLKRYIKYKFSKKWKIIN